MYDTDILTISVSNEEAGTVPTSTATYKDKTYDLDKLSHTRELSKVLLGGDIGCSYNYSSSLFDYGVTKFFLLPPKTPCSFEVQLGEKAINTKNLIEGVYPNPVKELFRRRDLVLEALKQKLPKIDLVFTSAEITELHQYYAVRNGNHIEVTWDNEHNEIGEVIVNGDKVDLYSSFTTSGRVALLLTALLKNKCSLSVECWNYYQHTLDLRIGKIVTLSLNLKDNELEDIKYLKEANVGKYLSDLLLLVDKIVEQVNIRTSLVAHPMYDKDYDYIVVKHMTVNGVGKYFYFHFCPNTYKFVKCVVGNKTYGDSAIVFSELQKEALPEVKYTGTGICSPHYEAYSITQGERRVLTGYGTQFAYGLGYYSLRKEDLGKFWDDFTFRVTEIKNNLT